MEEVERVIDKEIIECTVELNYEYKIPHCNYKAASRSPIVQPLAHLGWLSLLNPIARCFLQDMCPVLLFPTVLKIEETPTYPISVFSSLFIKQKHNYATMP